ncbi:MAG: DUF523 domain-containing protein [Dehalococcoidia bacterium]
MKLVSACLLGIRCTWRGNDSYRNERIIELSQSELLIPVCPEQLGGLPTPRPPQELQSTTGEDILDGKGTVKNQEGRDVTQHFIRGAHETLQIARRLDIDEFIGRFGSPSCGCDHIYDGSFSGKLVPGNGVTTALLARNGIRVTSEHEL